MTVALDAPLAAVEAGLEALALALQRDDGDAVSRCASDLHGALIEALRWRDARPAQPLPAALRERLLAARGQVAGQRESVARAQAAAARASEVLMPGVALYGRQGDSRRESSPSRAQA